ncbi:MAG: S41 family peptidase [Paludibacteraceae bacterium]|nr:S41 family peptidase [Paludibacteraceae bacterium]
MFRNHFFITSLLLGIMLSGGNAIAAEAEKTDARFELSKNLDVYNSILKTLNIYYVDSIHPQKLIRTSIDGMLASLDPYTNYIPQEEQSEFKLQMSGEYGGIGAIISQHFRDTTRKTYDIVISEPYEGMPAHKAGLQAGDIIKSIDGKKTDGMTVTNVSELLRGVPGTSVSVVVERPGTGPVKRTLLRQKIHIDPVTWYGMVDPQTGYILLNQFTENSADHIKNAIIELKGKGMKQLVLDLRNNPGGLLDQAVNILSFFVKKEEKVLFTRGKTKQMDEDYRTSSDPIEPNLPLAVLINGASASASEIVSGAIQDLDRGIVVGTRSYGKGLVQSTRPLPYDGSLKLTIAKYYTPSGRCIQAIDYAHRNEDGSLSRIPDSLTSVFHTRAGREVRDGGGITPDVEVKNEHNLNIADELYARNCIFDFATVYVQHNKHIAEPSQFSISDKDWTEFKKFVMDKGFSYHLKTSDALRHLKELAKYEGYDQRAKEEFDALERKLAVNVEADLEQNRQDILDYLNTEIIQRYYFQKGPVQYTLQKDPVLKKALEILNDKQQYNALLRTEK